MQTENTDNVIPETELARRRRVVQLADELATSIAAAASRAREYRELGVPTEEWLPLALSYAPEKIRDVVSQGTVWPFAVDAVLRIADGEPLQDVLKTLIAKASSARGGDDGSFEEDDGDDGPDFLASLMPMLMSVLMRPAPMPPPPPFTVVRTVNAQALALGRLIVKMLDAAPKVSPTDTPALEAMVVLRTLQASIRGSLSIAYDYVTEEQGGLYLFRMLSAGKDEKGSMVMVEQFFTAEDIVSFALVRDVAPTPTSRIFTT